MLKLHPTIAITLLVLIMLLVWPSLTGAQLVPSPPTTGNLHSVVMLNPSSGWIVGDGGVILHSPDGVSWILVASGTSADLLGLSFGPPSTVNSNSGFAVGGSGGTPTALFWNGFAWTGINAGLSSYGAQRLSSVFALSSNDAWAVDSVTGGFWHWTGTPGLGGGWSMFGSASAGLKSVFMTSSTDGWAVGLGGISYHYTGGGWTPAPSVGVTLNSLFMLDANNGWAVGNNGAIFRYVSGLWSGPVSPGVTSANLNSVFMINSGEGWAVGSGGAILHFLNNVWTALAPNQLPTNQDLNSVYFTGGSGWAVGNQGTIVYLSSGQAVPATVFRSVYLTSSSDGWVVGCSTGGCGSGSGDPVIAHWDGTSLFRGTVLGPSSDLYSAYMVSSSEGWAVGGVNSVPLILHYTGGSWVRVTAPGTGYILKSIFMTDAGNGWAVGEKGTILRYIGGGWGTTSSPTSNNLNGVFMLDSADGWIVGDGGVTLRLQAANNLWTSIASPTGSNLRSVFFSDASNGWAVGDAGTILHFDGTVWGRVASTVSVNLNAVWQVDRQVGWIAGDSGTILQWGGPSNPGWLPFTPSPPLLGAPNLYSISIRSDGSGLIVGAPPSLGTQGTIVRIGSGGYPIPEFGAGGTVRGLILSTMFILALWINWSARRLTKRN